MIRIERDAIPFGIGPFEIVVLLVIGVLLIGIPVGVILLVLFLVGNHRTGRVAELEAENQRLRKQLGDS